jgi:Tfp pilus assembly protein PilN
VKVLDSLSAALPDGIWLTALSYTPQGVTLAGRGTNITPLVGELERQPMFQDVSFASAMQRNAELGIDEFSMTVGLAAQEKSP